MTSRELPTVSFHYLRYLDDPQDLDSARGFSSAEFETLVSQIESQVAPDMGDKLTFERVRSGNIIPFSDFHRNSARCIFGTFKAPYTSYSFDNSDKGKIEAGSVNQRKFNYMLYRLNDGRIFSGAQYLGNYGGWGHLANGIRGFFDQKNKVLSTSIRKQGVMFEDVFPREIIIRASKKSEKLDEKNFITQEKVLTLQRGENSQGFEDEARKSILSILKKPLEERGQELRKALITAGLQEFDDYQIDDCVVVADFQKGTKRYHIFENGLRATRFGLTVPLDSDGHPEMEPTRAAMKAVFQSQILEDLAES